MCFEPLLTPMVVADWIRVEHASDKALYHHRQQPAHALRFWAYQQEVQVDTCYQGALKHLGSFYGEPSITGLSQALQPPPQQILQNAADLLGLLGWKHAIPPGTFLSWSRWYPIVRDPEDDTSLFDIPAALFDGLLESFRAYRRLDHAKDLRLAHAVRHISFQIPQSQHHMVEIFQRLEHHPLRVFLESP